MQKKKKKKKNPHLDSLKEMSKSAWKKKNDANMTVHCVIIDFRQLIKGESFLKIKSKKNVFRAKLY